MKIAIYTRVSTDKQDAERRAQSVNRMARPTAQTPRSLASWGFSGRGSDTGIRTRVSAVRGHRTFACNTLNIQYVA